ncbi:hypothetical protein N9N67_04080 [Bacteriovoracaceae bacterium]|nr:hypothetical protein [Bacteriovoracaceae bacterium]
MKGEVFDVKTDEPINEKKLLFVAPIQGTKLMNEVQVKQVQKIAVREIMQSKEYRLIIAQSSQSHEKKKFFALKIKVKKKKEFSIVIQIYDQQKKVVVKEFTQDLIPKLNLILHIERGIKSLVHTNKFRKRSVLNSIKIPVEPELPALRKKRKKKKKNKLKKQLASLKESIDEEVNKEDEANAMNLSIGKGESLADAPAKSAKSIFLGYAKLQGIFVSYNQQSIKSQDLFPVTNSYDTLDLGLNARLLEDYFSETEIYLNAYTGKVVNSPNYVVPTRLGLALDFRKPLFSKNLSFYGGISQDNLSYVNSNEFGDGLMIQENNIQWFSYGMVLEWDLVYPQWAKLSRSSIISAESTYGGEPVELSLNGNRTNWEYFINISKLYSIGIFGETIELVGSSDTRVLTVEKSDIGATIAYHF